MSDKKTIRDRVIDPGYRLPEVIDPGDTLCIRVYVPKDSLYLAAFWAQYERLGMWLAWERGGTRAKQAADLWKVAIQKARDINDCAEGDCGIMDVRTKPDYPCILQKWDDCESEWVDFADTRLCAPKMRVIGDGTLQQWNGTEWVSVAPGEGEGGTYEPGHDLDNQLSNWETVPPGQDGACLSAINAVTYLSAAIDASMIELKELPYLVRLVDSILTKWYWRVFNFAAFAVNMVTGLIWSMSWEDAHKLMSDKSLTNEDAIIAVNIIDDVLCKFVVAYSEDGTMTEGAHASLMSELQALIDLETPNSPRCLKLEWLMLLSFPGPTWMANISNNAGIDEYDCSVCDSWEHEFDFSTGLHGWTIPTYSGQPMGVYVEGVGIKAVYNLGYYRAEVDWTGTGFTMTKGGADLQWVGDETEYPQSKHFHAYWGASLRHQYLEETGTQESGYFEDAYTASVDSLYMYMTSDDGGTHDNGEVGNSYIKTIKVFGVGTDPWA